MAIIVQIIFIQHNKQYGHWMKDCPPDYLHQTSIVQPTQQTIWPLNEGLSPDYLHQTSIVQPTQQTIKQGLSPQIIFIKQIIHQTSIVQPTQQTIWPLDEGLSPPDYLHQTSIVQPTQQTIWPLDEGLSPDYLHQTSIVQPTQQKIWPLNEGLSPDYLHQTSIVQPTQQTIWPLDEGLPPPDYLHQTSIVQPTQQTIWPLNAGTVPQIIFIKQVDSGFAEWYQYNVGTNYITARQLVQVTDRVISLPLVLGNLTTFMTWYCYRMIESRTAWDKLLSLEHSQLVITELEFWKQNVE
ncbi:unnamed protein product [Mytilus coruscus]|uniref:Uncharacterized protein n=1 Tax=Mytilus coruscus TaxID=42192 RepID=A0A6J8BPA1_MYTCO|nr:unnamed protein product [Mytilus coruscus]